MSKIWILSDTHFGKSTNNTDKWLNMMIDYFYNWFIPLLKQHKKPNDKLFFLGDLYDNRTSLNLKVLNAVVKLFEDLSKIIEIHTLIGNHDAWGMTSEEITSVATIRNISNVFVYDKETILNMDNKSILMMPWTHGKNAEKEILEKYTGTDLLFCHSDLNGCRTQLYPTRPHSKTILDVNDFNGFDRVYSGHIHIVQKINNFQFVGTPYHLDRNDVENIKGVFVYDTKKNADVFIENEYSPMFKKHKIYTKENLIALTKEDFNNYIDLEISNKLLIDEPNVRLELDKLCNTYRIENIDYINDLVELKEKKPKVNIKNKSIIDLSKDWINTKELNINLDVFTDIEIKGLMHNTVEECFKLVELNKKVII